MYQLYSPSREVLSGMCNISHLVRAEPQKQQQLQNGVCCFDMWSDGFKTFGRTAGSSIDFHVLKEPSHSNGSSEALRWLPPKGGRLCRPPPRRGGRASISAALEDTAVALLAGSTLAISETSNPVATLWTGPGKRLLPSTAFLSARRLETQTRGNTGAFRCFSVSLSSIACNIMYCQGYNVLLIPMQKYN